MTRASEPATPAAGDLLAALVGATGGLVWFQDREGRLLYANDTTLKLLGLSAAEALGRKAVEFDTFADHGRRAAEARIYAGSPIEIVHGNRVLKDGAIRHYRMTMAPLRDAQGGIAGMVVQTADETEALRNAKILEGIGAAVPDLVFAKDLDLRFIYANRAFLTASGRTLDEVIGRRVEEILKRPNAAYIQSDRDVIETGRGDEIQTTVVTADGVRRIYLTRKFPLRAADGSIFGLTSVAADITEDFDARAELTRTAARLETISNVTPNIIWSSLKGGQVDFVNERWFAFTGLPADDSGNWQAGVHPDDVGVMLDAGRDGDASGAPMEFECRLRGRDGSYRWVLGRAILHDDPDGGGPRWTGSFTDIEELVDARRQAALALQARAEGEAHLQSILDSVPDPMVILDSTGIVRAFGTAAEAQLGWPAAEIIGRHVGVLIPEVAAAAAREAPPGSPFGGVAWRDRLLVAQRRDGSTFPFELSVGVVQSGGRTFYTGFVRDQTERLRAEAQAQALRTELAQVARLSELGSMASALAHELNQPLAAAANFVQGSARLLTAPGPDLGLATEGLGQAVDQIARAGDSIRRLRDFLDRGVSQRKPEALRELIDEALTLALAGDGQIRVKRRISPRGATVLADRLEIQQVLVHLVRNAVEAMAGREPRVLEIVARPQPEGLARISVSDSGPGVSEGVMHQLFQPFVSTKPNGMGVGLSICRAIVEAHGGRIWADESAEGGATFHFTLRATAGPG